MKTHDLAGKLPKDSGASPIDDEDTACSSAPSKHARSCVSRFGWGDNFFPMRGEEALGFSEK
jgi:hypothetical protein